MTSLIEKVKAAMLATDLDVTMWADEPLTELAQAAVLAVREQHPWSSEYLLAVRRRNSWIRSWRVVGAYPSFDAAIDAGRSLRKHEFEVRQTLAAGGNL